MRRRALIVLLGGVSQFAVAAAPSFRTVVDIDAGHRGGLLATEPDGRGWFLQAQLPDGGRTDAEWTMARATIDPWTLSESTLLPMPVGCFDQQLESLGNEGHAAFSCFDALAYYFRRTSGSAGFSLRRTLGKTCVAEWSHNLRIVPLRPGVVALAGHTLRVGAVGCAATPYFLQYESGWLSPSETVYGETRITRFFRSGDGLFMDTFAGLMHRADAGVWALVPNGSGAVPGGAAGRFLRFTATSEFAGLISLSEDFGATWAPVSGVQFTDRLDAFKNANAGLGDHEYLAFLTRSAADAGLPGGLRQVWLLGSASGGRCFDGPWAVATGAGAQQPMSVRVHALDGGVVLSMQFGTFSAAGGVPTPDRFVVVRADDGDWVPSSCIPGSWDGGAMADAGADSDAGRRTDSGALPDAGIALDPSRDAARGPFDGGESESIHSSAPPSCGCSSGRALVWGAYVLLLGGRHRRRR